MLTYSEVDLNGNLINDSNAIADAFNDYFSKVIWKTRTTWTRTTRTQTRKKYDKKQSERKMRKKSCHPFYKVTLLWEIMVRARVRVTVRVRLSMLSVSVLSVFSRYPFSNIGPDLADQINFNDSNRSYLDYLPNLNNNTTFQLRETNFSTVFALLCTL